MKLTKKELWYIYIALSRTAGYGRAIGRKEGAKPFEKLADKVEKELLK